MASRTSFTNVRISDSFGQLLIVGDDSGITSSSVQIFDADGTGSPLSLSTTQLTINDGANDFDIASHDGTNGLKLGGTLVTTSASELNLLDGLTAGTVTASKFVLVDSNSDISGFRNITATGTIQASDFTATGNTTIGNASSDTVAFNATLTTDIIFEGSSADANELTLSAGNPSGDRTVTLPDATDTLVGKATTDTLTNKSIDVDNNTVTNIEVDNLKSGVLDTDISSVSGSDDTLASAKAIKTYVDSQVTAQDLDATTDSGTIAIDLDSETLTIAGGEGIDTSGSTNTITIAGEDASTSNKGIASFSSSHFTVSSGSVSIATDSIDDTLIDFGTGTNQVNTDDLPEGSSNLYLTNERIDDRVDALATAGEGIDITYDDSAGTLTFAGEDASTSNKGIASFSSDNFDVSSGAVTIKNDGVILATETTGDFVQNITGGTGIDSTGATSGENIAHTLSIDLNELTTETTIADDDFIAMVDATDSGSGKITFENLEDAIFASVSGDVLIAEDGTSTIQANSVALGTDTTGNYVSAISGTSNEIEVSGSGSETATVTIGLPDDVTITGNLTVNGTTTTIDTTNLVVEDPLIKLAKNNNSADSVDIGFYGLYDTSGSTDLYAGLFRDANDSGKFKLFVDLQAEPTTTVNVSGTGYATGTLVANLEGNVTGTIQTASQTNITSVGTLGAGAISSGFGNIDIGSSNLTATGTISLGSTSFNDNNITNVGSVSLDSLESSGSTIEVSLDDNQAGAFSVKESSNSYITIDTSNSSEKIQFHKALDIDATSDFGSNAMTNVNIDSGSIDGATIATSDITVGTGKTLDVSGGTLTLANDQISGDKVSGGTIGTTTITALAGDLSLGDNAITNVGDIALDSISADNNTMDITLTDNQATALEIKESTNAYLTFVTTNSGEKITLGKKLEAGSVEIEGSAFDIDGGTIDGTDVTVGSGKTLDVSAGTLTLANDQISGDKVTGGTIGSITITALAGDLSLGDNDISNVGDISADSISSDGSTLNIAMDDNQASAFSIKESTNSYLTIDTTNSSEKIQVHQALDIDAVSDFGSNAMTNVNIDSGDIATAVTVGGSDTITEFVQDIAGGMFSGNTETGITATYQDGDNNIDLAINASQTTITSLLATDIVIGEDAQTKIDFETANEIHFDADNAERLVIAGGTTTTYQPIHFSGADAVTQIVFTDSSHPASVFSMTSAEYSGGGGNKNKLSALNSTAIAFETGGAERLLIDQSDAITIGQGMNIGTLHADVNLGTSSTEVFDLSNTAPANNTGDGIYLFNAVRRGGSYSTRFTGIIGVDNGGIAVVDTIENNGFTISVAGMVIKAVDSGGSAINISATLQPLAIGD